MTAATGRMRNIPADPDLIRFVDRAAAAVWEQHGPGSNLDQRLGQIGAAAAPTIVVASHHQPAGEVLGRTIPGSVIAIADEYAPDGFILYRIARLADRT